jgi:EPS-associated MarR family transcriptional regulator
MFEYKLIKEIESNPSHTQRTLARKLDVSLGKVNYVLSGLVQKGLVKARKLKNQPGKVRWQYILTREGMREKVRITRRYLRQRVSEFNALQREIESLENEIRQQLNDKP